MKAYVLKGKGNAVICDMPEPELKDEYAAILEPIAMSPCTSDVNTIYGSGSKKPDDLILGHECIARVVKTGNKVMDFKAGDKVVVPAITPDYRCVEIEDGNDRHAGKPFSGNALGRSIPGVFAEKFMIADADMQLAKIPSNVDDEAALMCADMMATGFTGAEAAEIKFGDSVIVFGIGAVGLMAIAAANLRGAGRIVAVGSRPVSVKLAKEYGACEVIDYHDDSALETIGKFDKAIICGGDDDIMEKAINVVKYGTGIVVNLKLFGGDGDIYFSKFNSGRGMGGKTIKTELCKGGRRYMERLLSLITYGRVNPEKLITKKLEGFDKIEEAMSIMKDKNGDTVKVMVIPEWK